MKVKATSTGTPSPALAGAFARLLVEAVKPKLKVVPKAEKAKGG